MSNDIAQYVEDLETQIAGNRKQLEIGQRLERLCKDQDFRALILQHWMVDEAARYAQLSQAPGLPDGANVDAMNMAAATGHFKRWMDVQRQMSMVAQNTIQEMNAELDRVRSLPEDGSDSE